MEELKIIGAWLYGAMPWLTGGLAGAILTFWLNRRLERKRRIRLSVTVSDINYSLPSHQSTFHSLKVSYDERPYNELRYYQFRVSNISQKTVASAPFVFVLAKDTVVIDQAIQSGPLTLDIISLKEPRDSAALRFEAKEIKPGDYFQISLLVSSTSAIKWLFRGGDDIEILADDRVSNIAEDQDVRAIIAAISLYVLLGSIPLISGIFKAAVVLYAGAIVRRIILRWNGTYGRFRANPQAIGQIIVGHHGRVIVDQSAVSGDLSVIAKADEE